MASRSMNNPNHEGKTKMVMERIDESWHNG